MLYNNSFATVLVAEDSARRAWLLAAHEPKAKSHRGKFFYVTVIWYLTSYWLLCLCVFFHPVAIAAPPSPSSLVFLVAGLLLPVT